MKKMEEIAPTLLEYGEFVLVETAPITNGVVGEVNQSYKGKFVALKATTAGTTIYLEAVGAITALTSANKLTVSHFVEDWAA